MRVDCARCGHHEEDTYEFDMPIAKAHPMEEYVPGKCPDCGCSSSDLSQQNAAGTIAMNSVPSIRRMWVLYKELLADAGFDRRDLILARESIYAGARCVFSALVFQADRGRSEEIERTIRRHGRQNKALMGLAPRKRQH